MPRPPIKISIQAADFDLSTELNGLTERIGSHDIGAVVTFSGICRSDGGTLAALELEHYPGMADSEIRRIAEDAASRWSVLGMTVIHRYGVIPAGENIVLVIAASSHRQAAFDAASFLMDFLKTRAPFWKKQHFADGREGGWVEAAERDDEAAARWQSDAR